MGQINWAWKIQGLRSNEKLLLANIADRADKDSGVCNVPVSRIARDCGGWSRQQTNRIIKRLVAMDLITVSLRFPGTDDTSRSFIVNLTIDADTWHPPVGKGSPHASHIMSTYDFLKLLKEAFSTTPQERTYFNDFISAIRPVDVKRGKLICKVPNDTISREIWKHREKVVAVAQKHISSTITSLRFFWDKVRKQS